MGFIDFGNGFIIHGSQLKYIMEDGNTMGYSDTWQPYKGDYDKFEYDVKLKDGREIVNCYPNAGFFNSMKNAGRFSEDDVLEIRFSQEPITLLNMDVSKAKINH